MTHYDLPHNHGQNIHKVLDRMPETDRFRALALLFQQLGDPTRMKVLWLLCHCEECVCNLAAALKMSPPAVSYHLRSLRESGLIVSSRRGKEVFYTLADTPQAKLFHRAMDTLFQVSCPTEE